MGLFGSKNEEEGEECSRKPNGSAFHQQKLAAWQPILTASTILPVFFTIGIIFIPIGIALLATSNGIKEKTIEYSSDKGCYKCEEELTVNFKKGISKNCKCTLNFNLTEKWEGDVFFYYGLTDFYQNHRRYVRSRDDSQLNGKLTKTVNSNCKPFDKVKEGNKSALPIAPCGAIANSLFTDVFSLEFGKKNKNKTSVPMSYKNIAWKSDRTVKFKNPTVPKGKTLKDAFSGYEKPKYWTKNIYELDTKNKDNNGFENQDFIVWMRVAAFPTFRKLYRRLTKEGVFKNGLPAGDYTLNVDYNYPVKDFNGKKRFILTTTSWMGGRNSFLGIIYIVVGCLCLFFGFVFLFIHLKVKSGSTLHDIR